MWSSWQGFIRLARTGIAGCILRTVTSFPCRSKLYLLRYLFRGPPPALLTTILHRAPILSINQSYDPVGIAGEKENDGLLAALRRHSTCVYHRYSFSSETPTSSCRGSYQRQPCSRCRPIVARRAGSSCRLLPPPLYIPGSPHGHVPAETPLASHQCLCGRRALESTRLSTKYPTTRDSYFTHSRPRHA